jgi:hypothetical protein
MDRLLEILAEARGADAAGLDTLTGEVDALAADVQSAMVERAVSIAIITAAMVRVSVSRSRV